VLKITDFLSKKAVMIDLKATDKKGVITELIEVLVKEKLVKDGQKAITSVLDREKIGTTGVGQSIAMPHGRTDVVPQLVGAFGISRKGIDFESLDGEHVHIIFLLLSPTDSGGQHLRALAKISRLFKDKFFRQSLMDCATPDDILKIIGTEDLS
jgi:PTS system nitrogen regulatory IIA component